MMILHFVFCSLQQDRSRKSKIVSRFGIFFYNPTQMCMSTCGMVIRLGTTCYVCFGREIKPKYFLSRSLIPKDRNTMDNIRSSFPVDAFLKTDFQQKP